MFSPRRRKGGRSAKVRLVVLGALSIAGILTATSSPDLTSTWLQPIRPALAQSNTTTPTAIPQPDAQPDPTAGLAEPPLTLHSSASVAQAAGGDQFSFTTTIAASSAEPRAIELRASIDGQIELVSTSGGSCSGGTAISCKLSVRHGQPATIVVAVRVRPGAAPGRLVYQALAQDDLSNTAASDQVVVTIAAAPATPSTPPNPAPSPPPNQRRPANESHAPAQPSNSANRPTLSAPTEPPASVTVPVARNTAAPYVLALPVVPAANMHSSAGEAASAANIDSAAQADSWLDLAPTAPGPAQAIEPSAPAPAVPEQEAPKLVQAAPSDAPASAPLMPLVDQRPIVQLPNTAAAPPIVVLVAFLLGLALTIHGVRRVRRAAAQIERQGAALGRLAKLVEAQARWRARIDERPFEVREE